MQYNSWTNEGKASVIFLKKLNINTFGIFSNVAFVKTRETDITVACCTYKDYGMIVISRVYQRFADNVYYNILSYWKKDSVN